MKAVVEKINKKDTKIDSNSLSIKNVEVKLTVTLFEAPYVDDDHSRKNIEWDVVKVEVPDQPSAMWRSLKDNEEAKNQIGE